MKRWTVAALAVLLCFAGVATARAQTRAAHPDSARIVVSDVANFWRAYDRLTPSLTRADSVRVLANEYIAHASPGLQGYLETHLQKSENLLMGLGLLPRYMAAVRTNTLNINPEAVRAALRRVEAFYSDATYPDIYFVIAGFHSQGTVSRGNVVIAAEMVSADAATPRGELPPFLRGVDLTRAVLPCIMVHEMMHAQQNYQADRSLLAQVLVEGVADFITQRAIGCVQTAAATYEYGGAHERELWLQFQREMSGTDYSKWLYNGNTIKDRPDQLGYWMGYQIAGAYYERARDKQQAIRDLLHIQDYEAVLQASGYAQKFEK
ncbi:MAG TPA: DUF2268 domain-containing putative Zn-dependent protease [Longimicrobiales bacterium]|nr:DUF2268 domain-containing putative Zn-dependent protease [Longimicrobiales bacterium]